MPSRRAASKNYGQLPVKLLHVPVAHRLPAQHGCPLLPQAVQVVLPARVLHTSAGAVQALPGQHAWPDPPHATQA